MSARFPTDLSSQDEPVLDQRKADLLAFVQQHQRAWRGGASIGWCWLIAPVIMTRTVHRPMELTVPTRGFNSCCSLALLGLGKQTVAPIG
jgi:hypothetical protein